MDETLKKQFDALCSDFGMNVSTAVTIFAKTIVRERRIPFEIAASGDPFYSEANQARLRESIAQLEAGRGVVHELIDAEDE
jgi:DNA-damage-inducible protein J